MNCLLYTSQNKINFVDGVLTEMSECLVYGLYVLFNSTIYDEYYRILNGSTPVSYTHLDVYKRQKQGSFIVTFAPPVSFEFSKIS